MIHEETRKAIQQQLIELLRGANFFVSILIFITTTTLPYGHLYSNFKDLELKAKESELLEFTKFINSRTNI